MSPRDGHLDELATDRALERAWATPPTLWGWFTTVDHKRIGRRYIATAFVFFLLAGLSAVAMRMQLAQPDNTLIGPDEYKQLFTIHGTTMMFLFAVPVMEAMAVYLIPLMAGTRNIAFPRLNAFSYWVYVFGGAMIWIAFMLNVGADTGWFAYVPLSGEPIPVGSMARLICWTSGAFRTGGSDGQVGPGRRLAIAGRAVGAHGAPAVRASAASTGLP